MRWYLWKSWLKWISGCLPEASTHHLLLWLPLGRQPRANVLRVHGWWFSIPGKVVPFAIFSGMFQTSLRPSQVLSNGPLEESVMERYMFGSRVKPSVKKMTVSILLRQQLLSGQDPRAQRTTNRINEVNDCKMRTWSWAFMFLTFLGLEFLHTQNPYILHRDIKA